MNKMSFYVEPAVLKKMEEGKAEGTFQVGLYALKSQRLGFATACFKLAEKQHHILAETMLQIIQKND